MLDNSLIEECALIRRRAPLVHSITNYVAMNMSAGTLLAIGALPIMSFCPDEMTDLVMSSNSLAINLGCLDAQLIKAARIAAATAMQAGLPWVLDPVGVGASELRGKVSVDLALNYHPTIIRANAGEFMTLARLLGQEAAAGSYTRGVDSTIDSSLAVDSAAYVAAATGSVVSMSGEVDWIIDGTRLEKVEGGSPMMSRVTAMGCSATGITAAFAAVESNAFNSALHAMQLMAICGERAAANCSGTASFATAFIDSLSTFAPIE